MNLKISIKRFWHDEEGASSVEYAILASLIAAVITATVAVLGTQVHALFAKAVALFPG